MKEPGGRSCLICEFSRYVEACHIVPQSGGGKETIPLCPTHHKLYDNGLLRVHELNRLPLEAQHWYQEKFGIEAHVQDITERAKQCRREIEERVREIEEHAEALNASLYEGGRI